MTTNLTLDGVMQAPGRPGEDIRGGFSHGGWALPYDDEIKAASTTLTEPLPWQNSTLLHGDAAAAVAELKHQPGPDLAVIGSGDLAQALARRDLVDQYVLLIHPLVLGSGRRLFPDGAPPAHLRLVDCVPTSTGVVIATYQPVQAG